MVRLRTLLAATLASAVLGGTVGALATAATSSQASPQAIAAAVAKVKDAGAEQSLGVIAGELKAINSNLPAGELAIPSIHGLLTLICEVVSASAGRLQGPCRNQL
jgi:hypothetical protein